jgi:hypothetical protein
MGDDEQANAEIDGALYGEDGVPNDPDPYPDSDEARVFMARLQEAEALGVDPVTLDLVDSGDLGL